MNFRSSPFHFWHNLKSLEPRVNHEPPDKIAWRLVPAAVLYGIFVAPIVLFLLWATGLLKVYRGSMKW